MTMYPLSWSPSMSMVLFYNNNFINLTRPGLIDHVRIQIEYYFSEDNLNRDFFLRSNMDAHGFVPVTLIASFRRLQGLTNNIRFVIDAIRSSTVLELFDGCKVRTRNEPWKWPIAGLPQPNTFRAERLNPNAPEFIPRNGASASTPARGTCAKIKDKSAKAKKRVVGNKTEGDACDGRERK